MSLNESKIQEADLPNDRYAALNLMEKLLLYIEEDKFDEFFSSLEDHFLTAKPEGTILKEADSSSDLPTKKIDEFSLLT